MKHFLLIFTVVLVTTNAQRVSVCYYSSWAVYRPGNGAFNVEDIDTNLCTHAIYAFIGLDRDGGVFSFDPSNDIDNGGFRRFNELRNINPNLKTLIALGGWTMNSSIFSEVASDPVKRGVLVTNLYDFVKEYDFSGLDLDWEYPGQRGGMPEDKANYVLLLQELRARLAPEGLLLTAAVHANAIAVDVSYDVPAVSANLDLINLMTYDYHGHWDNFTGLNSPLYASSTEEDTTLNVDATVQLWRQQGAPANKLVLGIPLYGRSFTLENAENHGVGVPTIGPGNEGPYTQEEGNLGFNEICEMLAQGGWGEQWELEQQVPYMYQGDQWTGYDNTVSVQLKAQYARQRFLAGTMVWSIDSDDFRGTCGLGRYPLLTSIRNAIMRD